MAENTRSSTRVAFGDVVRLSKERTSDADADGLDRYVGLEHIRPGDLRIRRWGDVADGTTFTNVFRSGQILFGKRRAYQRKVAVADFEGVCSSDIYVFEPKDSALLPELVPFICLTDEFSDHAVGTSAGSLSPRTKWESLARFEFHLPDLATQTKMVDALRAIQSTITCLTTLVDAAHRARSALLEQVLTANGWAMQPLGELASVSSGGTPRRSEPSYWNGKIPWIKTGEVNFCSIEAAEESITEEGLANSSARVAPAGSILMAMYGQGPTMGRVARLEIDAATNQACAIIRPLEQLDASFLYFYLWHRYQTIRQMARGASQPNLSLSLVKAIPVPRAPLSLQTSLAEHLSALFSASQASSRRAAEVQRLLNSFVSFCLRDEAM